MEQRSIWYIKVVKVTALFWLNGSSVMHFSLNLMLYSGIRVARLNPYKGKKNLTGLPEFI
jgi:hypothetical protein